MRHRNTPEENSPPVYAVRFAEDVPVEIRQEYERLAEISGTEIAEDWQNKLMAGFRTLATYPQGCALAAEDEHFQHIHPAVVYIRHIWHGARDPITFWPSENE